MFKGLSVAKNCVSPESVLLISNYRFIYMHDDYKKETP